MRVISFDISLTTGYSIWDVNFLENKYKLVKSGEINLSSSKLKSDKVRSKFQIKHINRWKTILEEEYKRALNKGKEVRIKKRYGFNGFNPKLVDKFFFELKLLFIKYSPDIVIFEEVIMVSKSGTSNSIQSLTTLSSLSSILAFTTIKFDIDRYWGYLQQEWGQWASNKHFKGFSSLKSKDKKLKSIEIVKNLGFAENIMVDRVSKDKFKYSDDIADSILIFLYWWDKNTVKEK